MKRANSTVIILLLGLGFSLLPLLLRGPWDVLGYSRLEGAMIDWLFHVRGAVEAREEVVILGIDSESMEFFEDDIEAHPELELLTEWPWPREVHAMLLDRLVEAGARVVVFDVLFLSPSLYGEADDALFREALGRNQDRVVIGCNFEGLDPRVRMGQLLRPVESIMPEGHRLTEIAGFVGYPREPDGRIRRARLETTASVAARQRIEPLAGEEIFLSLAALALKKYDPGVSLPEFGELPMIHYAGGLRTFAQFPVYHLFHDRYWRHNLRGGELFRDKIVLVGATAGFMQDEHETPFGIMPGVEIHANTMGMLLGEDYLREVPLWAKGVITVMTGMGAALLVLLWRGSHWLKFLLMLVITGGGAVGSVFLFRALGVVVAFPDPYFALFGAGISGMAVQFTMEQIERRRLRRTLGTFVSADVAEYLVAHPEEYEEVAVGKRRHCVILFSDVRGFTSMTESAESPEAFVQQLNEYLAAWVECVFAHQGTLDKFVGDAVMAVWGGIRSKGPDEDARLAVAAALDMRKELVRLNRRWKAEGRPEFRIGIGISAGEAMVGNMGSPGRKLEFTVIGDPVNVAARLDEETKERGRDLLISEEVQKWVGGTVETEFLGEARIRGKKTGVRIYAVA